MDVRVPTTGNAGEDAVVLDWNVAVGSTVNAGDILVTLETAKAVIEVDAPADGVVLKILFDEGDDAPEHGVLAILGEAGEVVADTSPTSDTPTEGAPTAPSSGGTVTAAQRHARSGVSERVPASPRARLLAERNSIDLAGLTGSGPGGRIIIQDVLTAKRHAATEAVPTAAAAVSGPPSTSAPASSTALLPPAHAATVVPVRGARKVTAQRMHASLQQTAQLTITRYAEADALLAYAGRLKNVTAATGRPKIGVNDLLLFATARAVVKHPAANSWFDWDGISQFSQVNLGFAVDTPQALLVPVIPAADTLTLAGVAEASRSLIETARAGRLAASQMEGGTFTVSNLGGLGVHWFTPVLNPPQTGILGVGTTHRSHPEAPALLPLSLTFDHRAIDGAAAAALLADIAGAIETIDVLAAF